MSLPMVSLLSQQAGSITEFRHGWHFIGYRNTSQTGPAARWPQVFDLSPKASPPNRPSVFRDPLKTGRIISDMPFPDIIFS